MKWKFLVLFLILSKVIMANSKQVYFKWLKSTSGNEFVRGNEYHGAVLKSNNLFVLTTRSAGGSIRFYLSKYDLEGNLMWEKTGFNYAKCFPNNLYLSDKGLLTFESNFSDISHSNDNPQLKNLNYSSEKLRVSFDFDGKLINIAKCEITTSLNTKEIILNDYLQEKGFDKLDSNEKHNLLDVFEIRPFDYFLIFKVESNIRSYFPPIVFHDPSQRIIITRIVHDNITKNIVLRGIKINDFAQFAENISVDTNSKYHVYYDALNIENFNENNLVLTISSKEDTSLGYVAEIVARNKLRLEFIFPNLIPRYSECTFTLSYNNTLQSDNKIILSVSNPNYDVFLSAKLLLESERKEQEKIVRNKKINYSTQTVNFLFFLISFIIIYCWFRLTFDESLSSFWLNPNKILNRNSFKFFYVENFIVYAIAGLGVTCFIKFVMGLFKN